jgi:hypothetical protein
MRKYVALSLVLVVCIGLSALAAVRGDKAMYVGGTLDIPERTKGKLDLSGEDAAVFLSKKGEPLFEIPYANITSLEYGQKAGRRVGVAIAVNPLFLFSKKRKHYVTIGFSDAEGINQGVVLELAKGTVHKSVTTFETRSGMKIEFESENAKKHYEKKAK